MSPPTERDGGPAFPIQVDTEHPDVQGLVLRPQPGMSLRDYAEVHIMAAMISAPGQMGDECRDNPSKAVAWARNQVSAWLTTREDTNDAD